jgi:hypothetical protein
VRTI